MALYRLKKELEHLEKIQEKHIAAFDSEALPDLENQMAERKKQFNALKTLMATISPDMNHMEHEPVIKKIMEQICGLIIRNRVLTTRVQEQKQGLENSMKRIKKGRNVIHAYGSSPSQRNRPKVINVRN